jgi:myo-inositol-1(or 4)-monophosphatase
MRSQIKSDIILRAAQTAALGAGKILMAHFGKLKASDIHQKNRGDFVTIADERSEKFILDFLTRRFPDDSVLAEESGFHDRGLREWVIDPLDGTGNFLRGIPLFAISIGIRQNGKTLAGVVFNPACGEMFTASFKRGAFLNGRRISISAKDSLSGALVATAVPSRSRHRFPQHIDVLKSVSLQGCDMRRMGSLALELASVACGRLDGLWAFDQAPWDPAAGSLLVTEAGGAYHESKTEGGADLVASNGKIQKTLVRLLRAQRAL